MIPGASTEMCICQINGFNGFNGLNGFNGTMSE